MALGARVLSELGDDPNRLADGKSSQEQRRHVTNHPNLGQTPRRLGSLHPQ
jgi:hypothetical protein